MVGRKKRSHSLARVFFISIGGDFSPKCLKMLIPEVGNTVSEGMELDCRVLYCFSL